MSEWLRVFRSGLVLENPLTRLMIGLCATLAVSNLIQGAFFMALAVIFVLVMSNVIVSSIRTLVPTTVRIPVFIVVIATFVTIVDLTMKAFLPSIYAILGIWIPLIVVNCLILGRSEAFAYQNGVTLSVADGLGKGLGFAMVIVTLGFVRELFGSGHLDFLGATLLRMPGFYQPPSILILFPGAFILFGFLMGAINAFESWNKGRRIRAHVDEGFGEEAAA
ncbi:MAG: electron transport complex subunit RsxE [Coriobacteriia bacterium]|nr:electron transport complex subunit RsxE [Coriobacteriia bacterium]